MTTTGLGHFVSGVILLDETIRQQAADGIPFLDVLLDSGIIPGIKIDLGAKPLAGNPGKMVSEGLDGLRERLQEYARMGVRFAKWRAVFVMGDSTPSRACVQANAHALARYAALCQETDLVPIVEPEVLMAGGHTMSRCADVTADVLHEVFEQLRTQGVVLEGMLLKPNMILAGTDCPEQESVQAVAAAINTDHAQRALLRRAKNNTTAPAAPSTSRHRRLTTHSSYQHCSSRRIQHEH